MMSMLIHFILKTIFGASSRVHDVIKAMVNFEFLAGNNYILSLIMIGRCSGLFIVPTIVTSIFIPLGAMSMMYTLAATCILLLATFLCAQFLVYHYGTDGKLHTKYRDAE